jgi:hypothetical protein
VSDDYIFYVDKQCFKLWTCIPLCLEVNLDSFSFVLLMTCHIKLQVNINIGRGSFGWWREKAQWPVPNEAVRKVFLALQLNSLYSHQAPFVLFALNCLRMLCG